MNSSRRRTIGTLSTLLGAAALGACVTTTPAPEPTLSRTREVLNSEFGVAAITTDVNAAVTDEAQKMLLANKTAPIYNALHALPNEPEATPYRETLQNELTRRVDTVFTALATQPSATAPRIRQEVSLYVNPQQGPAYEKDGEILINLPGPKSERLTFTTGKLTAAATIDDLSTLPADYKQIFGMLGKDQQSLVYGRDNTQRTPAGGGAAEPRTNLDALVWNYVTTGTDSTSIPANGLVYLALRDQLKNRFSIESVSGEIRANSGTVNGTTVYAISLPDGATYISDDDFVGAATRDAVPNYVRQNGNLRVRLMWMGHEANYRTPRQEGFMNNSEGREPSITLAQLYAAVPLAARAGLLPAEIDHLTGMSRNLDENTLVEALYAANPQRRYAEHRGQVDQMGVVFVDTPFVAELLKTGNVLDRNGNRVERLLPPGRMFESVKVGLQLYRQ